MLRRRKRKEGSNRGMEKTTEIYKIYYLPNIIQTNKSKATTLSEYVAGIKHKIEIHIKFHSKRWKEKNT
jgi:hypothetical protein